MKLKPFLFLVATAAVAASVQAAAVKKPVTEWTCTDFLAIDDEIKPKAVYWATAYAKGDSLRHR